MLDSPEKRMQADGVKVTSFMPKNTPNTAPIKEPIRIAPDLGKCEDFPIEAMPDEMKRAIEGIAALTQAPKALAAYSLLGSISLAGQALRDVMNPATGAVMPASLFLLSIAKSGERKSTVDKFSSRAIEQAESLEVEQYESRAADHQNEMLIWNRLKAQVKGSHSEMQDALREIGPEPKAPRDPMMRLSEPTIEGLFRNLTGRHSLGVFTSEGGTFLGGHGMKQDAKISTITTLTSLWDGQGVQRVRASKSDYFSNRRVSACIAVQPVLAADLLNDTLAAGQGFLPRFLVSYPESTIGTRFISQDVDLTSEREKINGHDLRVNAMLDRIEHNQEPDADHAIMVFAGMARASWFDFYNELELQANPETGRFGDESLQPFANRGAENAARVAALLTLYQDPRANEISLEAFEAAKAIVMYSLNEAARIIGKAPATQLEANAQALVDWLHDSWNETAISPPNIMTFGPNKLRKLGAIKVRELVQLLVDNGDLRSADGAMRIKGKVAREAYLITPRQ